MFPKGAFKVNLHPRGSTCSRCINRDYWTADLDIQLTQNYDPKSIICVKEIITGISNSISSAHIEVQLINVMKIQITVELERVRAQYIIVDAIVTRDSKIRVRIQHCHVKILMNVRSMIVDKEIVQIV